MTTCYAAGPAVSPRAVCLKPTHIDSKERMVIRVEQGKGQKESANFSLIAAHAETTHWTISVDWLASGGKPLHFGFSRATVQASMESRRNAG